MEYFPHDVDSTREQLAPVRRVGTTPKDRKGLVVRQT